MFFTHLLKRKHKQVAMPAAKLTADLLLQAAKERRTHYALSKKLPVPTSRIKQLVDESTLHTPSAFNSQSNRVVLLLGSDHEKLWEMTSSILRGMLPDDQWQYTSQKMDMFKAAAGTALFFDDQDVVKGMQEKFPTYADSFPVWATQSNAMQQWLLWAALGLEGIGGSLQHYGPIVESKVASTWNIPASWKLNAQLVFGGKTSEPDAKEFAPLNNRVKVFGN